MIVKARKGDTLFYYSEIFLINFQLILDANRQLNSREQINLGDEVVIPGYIIETYEFQKDDSLVSIANRLRLSVDVLLLLNENINESNIKEVRKIVIPKRVNCITVSEKRAYDSALLEKDLASLKEIYPFIEVSSIGKTVLSKEIFQIKIGNGPKKIQFNGSFHANEWITTPILMKLVNEYLISVTNDETMAGSFAARFYNEVELTIVPMVNSDGVDLVLNGPPQQLKAQLIELNNGQLDFSQWKANIRGIDLNNQFPANWEIEKERKLPKSPAPRDYPGDAPLTEPEAIAMANLAEKEKYDMMLAFHTQGKEFYWGYEQLEPAVSREIAKYFSKVSGYKEVKFIDSHAGYKDWFIEQFRKPSFTMELGIGENPLPLSQFDEIYEAMRKLFIGALLVSNKL